MRKEVEIIFFPLTFRIKVGEHFPTPTSFQSLVSKEKIHIHTYIYKKKKNKSENISPQNLRPIFRGKIRGDEKWDRGRDSEWHPVSALPCGHL